MDILEPVNTAPPTVRDSSPAADPRDLAWPGWIGGFAIGLSALGLLGVCCGSLGLASGAVFASMSGFEMPPPPRIVVVTTAASFVPGVALVIYELLGGIATLRRKARGPRMLLRYAVIAIVLSLLLAPLSYLAIKPGADWGADIMHAQLDAMEKNGGTVTQADRDDAEAAREITAFNYVSTYGMTVVGLVFPVVLLVFLRRPAVRAQWQTWEA